MNHQRILNLLSNLKCTPQVAQHNEYCIRKHVNSFFLNELLLYVEMELPNNYFRARRVIPPKLGKELVFQIIEPTY